MSEKINFNSFKEGTLEGVCALVKISDELKSKSGNPYINLSLFGDDGSNRVVSYFVKKSDFTIPEKAVIKAKFDYNNKFLNISSIAILGDDSYKLSDFVRTAPMESEKCYDVIMKTLNSLDYESEELTLYSLTKKVLETYKERLLYFPASEKMHHAYIGGLIYHIMKMMIDAYNITKGMYQVDREVVISAVCLSSICKLFTINTDGIYAETNLYNYIYNNGELSLKIVENIKTKLETETNKKVNDNKFSNLSICIKSFRFKKVQGASITPLTEESYLSAMIHIIDTYMEMYEDTKRNIPKGTISDYNDFIKTQVLNI